MYISPLKGKKNVYLIPSFKLHQVQPTMETNIWWDLNVLVMEDNYSYETMDPLILKLC